MVPGWASGFPCLVVAPSPKVGAAGRVLQRGIVGMALRGAPFPTTRVRAPGHVVPSRTEEELSSLPCANFQDGKGTFQ